MAESDQQLFERVTAHARQTALLETIQAVLEWDERTHLPAAGGAYRAEQVTWLAGQVHQRRTDPQWGEWLERLAASPLAADRDRDAGATIYWLRRDYDRQRRLPRALVEELARAAVLGQQAWEAARKTNDFASFAPHLQRIVRLKRRQAEALGYDEEPYDALLEEYEPGETARDVAGLLGPLAEQLSELVARIGQSGRRPRREILQRACPADRQRRLARRAAERIGFDFRRGRLDVTAHPFCTTLGPHDCRITARYDERNVAGGLFAALHEAGHGIYEQGLRTDQFGLPLGAAASLGVHESQSRLWENAVGRSRAFWEGFYPEVQQAFPEAFGDVPLDDVYFAINEVRPSLIRVEADEATYNLHIVVRFELERAMLHGDLDPRDAPGAWREHYRRRLGVEPKTDAEGVLQDIHWAAGLVGYFPTYTLGNVYAAQLYAAARRDIPQLDAAVRRGDFQPLRSWLQERIYQHGRRWPAKELVARAAGAPRSWTPLIHSLQAKLGPLYRLDG